ncbi:Hypothetical protein LUCI_4050 [Lucifera butyrica]|uniref:Metalloenzyme domain-containing protein n=1 Tax=Lucifera butyrica TaxID=1351585 RepID=A0A498RBZ7_9FIRM|nr:metalloenzyme [Lucifera butyrica]VBB08769.1 Hypothetical protein LUCI_4050 [Lucifera butyrica]
MPVLLIFIDGLGLGERDPAINPLCRFPMRFFSQHFDQPLTRVLPGTVGDVTVIPTDAALGVPGLPQSATGQAALFTGVNAPHFMGRHIQAFPGPRLTGLIHQYSIMKQLKEKNFRVTSANMYTSDYMELAAAGKRRHAATTLTILSAGEPLRSLAEMEKGMAVYQDLTNEMLPLLGVRNVPVITPATAGQRLLTIAGRHHFTLFEYFQTDRCGHKRDWENARKIVMTLDEFFLALYRHTPPDTLVIITSDHGNFEDFSIKTHTTNLVPTILWGRSSREFALQIKDLTDITPGILGFLERNESCG